MLSKIISIIFVIIISNTVSYGIKLAEFNETKLFLSINSQLSELRSEQERHVKMTDEIIKILGVKNCPENIKDELVKISEVQSLKAELEQLKKDYMESKSDIGTLKAELQSLKLIIVELAEQKNQKLSKTSQTEPLQKIFDGFFNTNNSNICSKVKSNGIYELFVKGKNSNSESFKVLCDTVTQGGGWTVILKRIDGSVDFYRNWTEYKNGFGDMNTEFFLGLDKIHAITAEKTQELLIVLEDFAGAKSSETYDEFAIGNEEQHYKLYTLGKESGTAGDSLSYHRDMKFTTLDRDNDLHTGNCASEYTGAWWYKSCHYSNLAGKYNATSSKGIHWNAFRDSGYSLKKALMMIRPRKLKMVRPFQKKK